MSLHRPPVGLLSARGVVVRRGERTVVDRVDVEVHAGRTVALAGPSGSGKSTLLGVLAGLEEPAAGEVLLDGAPLASLPPETVRARLGVVLQGLALLPHLTAAENVLVAVRAGPGRRATPAVERPVGHVPPAAAADAEAFGSGVLLQPDETGAGAVGPTRRPLTDDQQEALAALARVGLADRADQPSGRMSGGEQQRVALARALVRRPSVLLVDEPTSQLDAASRTVVLDLLAGLTADGLALVVATHDDAVRAVCTSTVLLG